ncbi:unnamed protein product [Eruca vesicaria subsp. sativa]|uniref:Prolamin-like domain-containing protein n=1 Tax=Eruca vesicaria subsp. sativa TaxID=29727 RepID=A0ABC8K622_ERUVS|nr:unnamed protein product [Eruca vesicaria subsp. sativa]
MKNVTLVIAMIAILFSSCVTSKLTETELESSTNQELFLSRVHWPFGPFRGPVKRFPPIREGYFRPIPFYLPEEVIRCLSDKEEVGTCFDDISMTFFTREIVIGSECCDAIKKMNADCEKTSLFLEDVFGF